MLHRCYQWFHHLLHRPLQILSICLGLACIGVVLDGTAFRLWSLHRDHGFLTAKIQDASARSKQLEFRIRRARQPEFIEKAVRDQFDLVKEGDLIFIFSDDGSEVAEKTTKTPK